MNDIQYLLRIQPNQAVPHAVRHAIHESAAETFCGVDRSILVDETTEVMPVSDCPACRRRVEISMDLRAQAARQVA